MWIFRGGAAQTVLSPLPENSHPLWWHAPRHARPSLLYCRQRPNRLLPRSPPHSLTPSTPRPLTASVSPFAHARSRAATAIASLPSPRASRANHPIQPPRPPTRATPYPRPRHSASRSLTC